MLIISLPVYHHELGNVAYVYLLGCEVVVVLTSPARSIIPKARFQASDVPVKDVYRLYPCVPAV